jgi:hypothetical protein
VCSDIGGYSPPPSCLACSCYILCYNNLLNFHSHLAYNMLVCVSCTCFPRV